MVSGTKFDEVDQDALNLIKNSSAKKILLINKIDLVADKSVLFEFVKNLEEKIFLNLSFQFLQKRN